MPKLVNMLLNIAVASDAPLRTVRRLHNNINDRIGTSVLQAAVDFELAMLRNRGVAVVHAPTQHGGAPAAQCPLAITQASEPELAFEASVRMPMQATAMLRR